MKQLLLILIMLLSACSCFAQNKVEQRIEKEGNYMYILSHGERFVVDKKLLRVKPLLSDQGSNSNLKVIHTSKSGYQYIDVPDEMSIERYVEKLENSGLFDIVEYVGTTGRLYFSQNDVEASYQNIYLSKIYTNYAWDITTGDPNIKVAIIDTGFQRDHIDIGYGNGNYTNSSYSLGYDYYTNTTYQPPTDNHGTMVAGIIGAKTNNGICVSGISGGNGCKGVTIISYRLGYDDGEYLVGCPYKLSDAIMDAVDDGARVINICVGVDENSDNNSAIEYAYNHGVTIVCAAGRNTDTQVPYPASHSKTIAVGAIDQNTNTAFADLGVGLDLVAPGSLIRSTTRNNSTGDNSGTSFATPLVSGTIALMLSVNSSLTPDQIRTILHKTATKVSGYTYNNYGWNSEVGYGLLNTFAAVLAACNPTIIEDTTLCYGSSVTIPLNSLPSGLTVQWSWSDGYGPSAPTIQTSGNSCTIANNLTRTYRGKLNAKVFSGGNLIGTLTKDIILNSGFYGQYTSDNLSGTISYSPVFYVKPGFNTAITSPNLIGATVSYDNSGTTPLYFQHDPTLGKLQFTMPTNNGGTPVIINVYDVCGNQSLLYAMPQNSYYLSISYEDSNVNISLNEEGDALKSNSVDQAWSYEIRSATRGDLRASGIVNSRSTTISTAGWPKGIYIIKATIGKEETTEKIIVR